MNKITLIVVCFFSVNLYAQDLNNSSLSFSEYIGLVKSEHPLTKQAELKLQQGNANLIKARGGFDPKIDGGLNTKEFKDKNYYDQLNAKLKIPTWYGVELQGGFEDNSGLFLNPENTVPNNGLYSAGVSASLAQGLFINKRMADLKKAKAYQNQTIAEKQLLMNETLYQASVAYFNWQLYYNNLQVYEQFLNNAKFKLKGIKRQVIAGEKAAIDSVEATIIVDNRKLDFEKAKIDFNNSRLELSNYLWTNNIPLEIKNEITPLDLDDTQFNAVLNLSPLKALNILNHPKIKALDFKTKQLEIDKRFKANKLLPKIDVAYNFITQQVDHLDSYYNSNYKAKIKVSFPLFLRKERGDLKLAKIKLEAINFDRNAMLLSLNNKIKGLEFEVENFKKQVDLIKVIVSNYTTLLKAEERKFDLGESAIFLVNTREKSLIDAKIKVNKTINKYFKTRAKLFNSLGVVIN